MPDINLLSKNTRIYLNVCVYWPEILFSLILLIFLILCVPKEKNIVLKPQVQIIKTSSQPIIKKIFYKSKASKSKIMAPPSEVFVPINYSNPELINEFFNLHGKSLLSKNGHYFFDQRQHELWIQDDDYHIKHIINILKELDKPTKQILIETRIVNLIKEASLDIGIKINNNHGPFNMDLGKVMQNSSILNMAFSQITNNNILDLQLAALEASNKAKIIASPKITTINHQAAIIESGEDIPYQESSNNGGTTTSFKKAVLSLNVTPHILPNNKLLLNLKIQQDLPSNKTINGVPSVITKAMKSHVLLNNGETIMLGGIYQINVEDELEHTPFWGDMPVLKQLINKKIHKKRREQLVIFITPHIM